MEQIKQKSYAAKKNEGNNLFFLILRNILTTKSIEVFRNHLDDPTFDDVYTIVGTEKALMKCPDMNVLQTMINTQTTYSRITDKEQHYYYLLNTLPKTFKTIDWKA